MNDPAPHQLGDRNNIWATEGDLTLAEGLNIFFTHFETA